MVHEHSRLILDRKRSRALKMTVPEYRAMKNQQFAQSRGFSSWGDYQLNRIATDAGFENYAQYKQRREERELKRIEKRRYEVDSFNEELIYLFMNSGITEAETARKLRVSLSSISKYLHKARHPSERMQERLIKILRPKTLDRILEIE